MVQKLLASGVDPNAADEMGRYYATQSPFQFDKFYTLQL